MVSIIKNIEDLNEQICCAGDKLVLLDFYATWCGPCKKMDPIVKQMVNLYRDKVVALKINVDEFPIVCDYYKVKSMPTFVFLRNSRRLSSFAGADANMLAKNVMKYIK